MASDAVTETQAELHPDITPQTPDSSQNSIDDPLDVVEKWAPITKLIAEETRKAFPSSPSFDPEVPQVFQRYWKGVFTKLQETIIDNPDVPEYLTEPPVQHFKVRLFDKPHPMCCPCSLPDFEADIHLHNENGVTKGDLIKAITHQLYGDEDDPPIVWEAEISGQEIDDYGALVYWSDWMSGGCRDDGQRSVYGYWGGLEDLTPSIVLYCSSYETFESQVEYVETRWGKKRQKDGRIENAIRQKL